jgi:hypothetical protein
MVMVSAVLQADWVVMMQLAVLRVALGSTVGFSFPLAQHDMVHS